MDPKLTRILDFFSEFHVKVLEQAIISYYKPEINSIEVSVSFTFSGIDIESYNPKLNAINHPIEVYYKSKEG